MSWLPILLIVWVTLDVLIVAAVAHVTRHVAPEDRAPSGPHQLAARARPPRRPGRTAS